MTTVHAATRASQRGSIEHLDWSSDASQTGSPEPEAPAQEAFSPARRVLPWALLLLVLSLVSIGYAVVLRSGALVTAALVLTATVLGAVAGLTVRDGRDRWVPTTRALRDGLRRLGHALWS